jgi:hypothetical protein
MKGQVTGFAIIGILLLIVVAGLTYMSRPASEPGPRGTSPSLDIESCIENSALEVVRTVGLSGGMDPEDPKVFWDIGSNPLGIIASMAVRRALVPLPPGAFNDGPDENHHFASGRTALNTFPRFENDPVLSTSDVLTTNIREAVEGCADPGTTIDLSTITYSEKTITIRTSVSEPDRSRYDMTVTLPIPIRTYHQVLRRVIQEENTNPQHLIMSVQPRGDYRITTHPHDHGHTIVIIESDRPLLGTEPFRYVTIIDNRPPVFLYDNPEDADDCDALQAFLLVDPDDGHTPEITGCEEDSDENIESFTIKSGGEEYEVEL